MFVILRCYLLTMLMLWFWFGFMNAWCCLCVCNCLVRFGSWNIVNVVGCFCGGVDCLVDLS